MEQDVDVSDVDGKTQSVEDPPVLPYQTHMWFQLKTLLTSILLLIAVCFGASAKQAGQETWIDIGAIVVEVGPGVVAAIRRGEVLGKLDYLSKPLAKTQAPSVNPVSSGGVAGNNASVAGKGDAHIVPAATKPIVVDPKLQNLMDNIYKGVDNPNRVGDGTLADAVRHERATGGMVHGLTHSIKAQDTINGLNKFIDNPLPGTLRVDIEEAITQRLKLMEALGS